MYQSLLVLRYLTSRIIPLIAVAAVALCVTLVIVVVSVMTGFLEMLKGSGRTLVGDVIVSREVLGIPYYEEFIHDIEALPEALAASPVVESIGLLRMPYGPGRGSNRVEMVQVWGIDPESLSRVIDYRRTIYWKAPTAEEAASMQDDDPRLDPSFNRLDDAMTLRRDGLPGIVLGIEFSPFNLRQRDGSYRLGQVREKTFDNSYWLVNTPMGVTLTLVPVSEKGSVIGDRKQTFAIVNEFQTGVFQFDSQRALAPIAVVQDLLGLSSGVHVDPSRLDERGQPLVIGEYPARATTILVKAKPDVSPKELSDAVRAAYERFVQRHLVEPASLRILPPPADEVRVQTWEERLKMLIGPIEKERSLMQTLFSLVYMVCAGLVLAIFWAIVAEKTRDIGILRSIGASRAGILAIFLAYGLAIGALGSVAGFGLATFVVRHINEIHTAMGAPAPPAVWIGTFVLAALAALGVVRGVVRNSVLQGFLWTVITVILVAIALALRLHKGFSIWDPSVYYFSKIPSQVDTSNAVTTMIFATVCSVLGAAVPAARAADTDPVRSLRYE